MKCLPLALLVVGLSHSLTGQTFTVDLQDSSKVEIISEGIITISSSGACNFKKTLPAYYVFYDEGIEGREAFVDLQGNLLWEMEDNWQELQVIEEDNRWQIQRTSTVEPYTLEYFNSLSDCDINSDYLFTNPAKTHFTETERYTDNSDSYQLKLTAEATAYADIGWQTDNRQTYKPTKLRMNFSAKHTNQY